MKSLTTQQLATLLGGRLEGPGEIAVNGVEAMDRAGPGHVTIIGNAVYAQRWPDSKAVAAIVRNDLEIQAGKGRAFIRVSDPDLATAKALEEFAPPPVGPPQGIDARAVVHPDAVIGAGVAIGPMCTIGARTKIGEGTVIHPNITVLDDVEIGAHCVLWPGVVIRERCIIGDGCILHPNVTIGSDGFGYRPSPDEKSLVKIPHIGIVRFGRAVELGAGTCVDRAKFSETYIGDGTKFDNLCHVGHNCYIGRGTLVAGLTGFGGSVTVGDGVMIGGGCIIKDHVTIGNGARLGGCSSLMRDIPAGESWLGTPAHDATAVLREYAALPKLPELLRLMKQKQRSDAGTD